MSAALALKVARDAGVHVEVKGARLILTAAEPPPAAVLDLLSRHKEGVLALLRTDADGWSAEDWQIFFDERAGIAEFDGRMPRREAEAAAFEWCIVEWLNRNPVNSPPDVCHGCGGGEHAHEVLLPFGTISEGRVWLHSRCWATWYASRRADAVLKLETLGRSCPFNHNPKGA